MYALTSHNPINCNRQFICRTLDNFDNKGYYGVTFDGFVFKSPIKDRIIQEGNHYVGMLGAQNRIVSI